MISKSFPPKLIERTSWLVSRIEGTIIIIQSSIEIEMLILHLRKDA